jgi:hypothetical protein
MVLKMRYILLFFMQSLVFTMSIAQEQAVSLIALPHEMRFKIALGWDCLTIRSLKCACKDFNNEVHYDLLAAAYVKKMPHEMCTKALMQFAHVNKEKNFFHFFSNNCHEDREEALQLLDWDVNETTTLADLMKAYRFVVNVDKRQRDFYHFEFDNMLNNAIVSDMFCLSHKVNARYFDGKNTVLMWAARYGKTAMVASLLQRPDIDPNIQNDIGNTALILAAAFRHTDIVALLLGHYNIDADIKNDIGNSAIDYL